MPLSFQGRPDRGQRGGLPRPRGTLDERQRAGPSQRGYHHLLGAIQFLGCFDPTDHVLARTGGTRRCVGGAGDEPGREFALNGQDL